MAASQSEYRRALQALLPPGAAWPREPDAVLTRLLDGWAEEFARADARAGELLDEADPRTAVETLPEWETDYGLAGEGTDADRHAALVAALNAQGGAAAAFFIALAAAAGVAITISTYRPFEVGRSMVGEALYNGTWRFTWLVTGPAATPAELQAELEALFATLKPSHTAVTFDWSA
jgi:uncharacterized protein YmfQ (DUF2313 family)